MKDTAAIIVAGGKGLRFGGEVRKQYVRLLGRPIVWWSLSAFEHSPSIVSVILVVPPDDLKRIRKAAASWKLKKLQGVVGGGLMRADSVRSGLAAVSPSFPRKRESRAYSGLDPRFRGDDSQVKYIAVHDAVRPLVTPQTIEAVIRAARRHKAAIAAVPSKDTVKLADAKGFIKATPPRETVWLAQTPQVFRAEILLKANNGAADRVTDDAQLVERLGVRVRLVESHEENFKVTFPADLIAAKTVISGRGGPCGRPQRRRRSIKMSGGHKDRPYR